MSNYIYLSEAKKHCRIEHDFEDDYLATLIDVAERSIENDLQVPLALLEEKNGGSLPTPVRQAILLQIGNLYENRESISVATLSNAPQTYDFLLGPYRHFDNQEFLRQDYRK